MSFLFGDAQAALAGCGCPRPPACEPSLHNGNFSNAALIYTGTDITGNVFGRTNSYCRIPESAYHTVAFDGMWQFWITRPDGTSEPVYCMEKGKRGPDGEPFHSVPIAQAMPSLTQRQISRIAWILANGYPANAPAELFQRAGVDALATPQLNSDDAYAATQVALWSVINTPQDPSVGWTFLDCVTNQVHPKSDRLKRTVNHLYNGSITMGLADGGNGAEPRGACVAATGCCRKVCVDGAELTDCGSLETLREACGKLLYGPLMVQACASFDLRIKPVCEGTGPCGFITLADACGNPIQAPGSGQEFYIAFPPSTPVSCYQITLSVAKVAVGVVMLVSDDPALQVVGMTLERSCKLEEASLCMCFAPPACCPPCPKPCAISIQPCCPPPEPGCWASPNAGIVPKHIFPPAPHHAWR